MSNTYTDANGYTFFNKGSMPQLMTRSFTFFILFSQIVFAVIQTVAPTIGGLICLIAYIIWFTYDYGYLKEQKAFVPSGWWFLFLPVYIYKRQNRNGNSRLWVLWYLLTLPISVFIVAVVMAALNNGHY